MQQQEAPPLGGYLCSPTHQHRPKHPLDQQNNQQQHPQKNQHPTIRNKPLNQTPQQTDIQDVCGRGGGTLPGFSTDFESFPQLIPTYPHKLSTRGPRDLLIVRLALGGGGLLRLCDGVPVVFVLRGGGC